MSYYRDSAIAIEAYRHGTTIGKAASQRKVADLLAHLQRFKDLRVIGSPNLRRLLDSECWYRAQLTGYRKALGY